MIFINITELLLPHLMHL